MPANLPPQYYDEEKKLKTARTPEEKAQILENLLRLIPKHKGTEKLQGDLKRRLSKARAQEGKKSGGKRKGDEHYVPKEGAGQIVLAGLPNVGKSTIVDVLTNAAPLVAEYPYSTLKPLSGMARFENILIQLVDIPPLMWEVTDKWVTNILRNADAICLVAELHDDPVGQVEILLEDLENKRIRTLRKGEEGERAEGASATKRVFIAGTKQDLPGAADGLSALKVAFEDAHPTVTLSAATGTGLEPFLRESFQAMDRIRVYTKVQGKKADLDSPFIMNRGTTVIEMAREIHKDFAQRFRAARIFCEDKYNGQRVSKDFVLRDGDIIEILA